VARYRNLGLFLVLAVLWGSAFAAIKAGLEYFPPVLFAALRYDVAAVLMLGYVAVRAERTVPEGRTEWAAVAVGGTLMIGAYHAFLFVGEQETTSAAAAVIVSLSPVLTTVLARSLLPDEHLSAAGIAGLLFGLVGVAAVSRFSPGAVLAGDIVGELLVFVAALAFALGSVVTKSMDADVEIETMEAWSMVGGAALLHVASLAVGESVADVAWTAPGLWALAYLSVGSSAVGFLVYFDLLERLGPVEINLVSYAAPVVAAATGFLLLGEAVDAWTAAGFCCILVGFGLIKRDALRSELPRFRAAFPERDS
jgi:probable blue pigment (indigoidine) exporter